MAPARGGSPKRFRARPSDREQGGDDQDDGDQVSRISRVLRERDGKARTADPSAPMRAVSRRCMAPDARPRPGARGRLTTAGGADQADHPDSGRRAISAVPCTRRRGGRSSTTRRSRTRPGDTSTDGSGCPQAGGNRVGGGVVSATCRLAPYGCVLLASTTSTASRGTPSEVDGSTAIFLITPCSATSLFSPSTTSTPPSMRRNGSIAVSRTVPSSTRPSQRSVRSTPATRSLAGITWCRRASIRFWMTAAVPASTFENAIARPTPRASTVSRTTRPRTVRGPPGNSSVQ